MVSDPRAAKALAYIYLHMGLLDLSDLGYSFQYISQHV